jgi:hypothetical protein
VAAHKKFGRTAAIDPSIVRALLPLPFVPGTSPLAQPAQAPEPADALPDLTRAHKKFGGTAAIDPATLRRAALPFGPDASPPAAPEAPAPSPPAEPELPLAKYPLERCAAITASMARRKADRGAILEKNELTEEVWSGLEQHWAEVIKKDLERGKMGTLRAFDAAYVGRLEEERGAVTVEEYARLVVASERGAEKEALDALGLPRGAMMRVKRVWDARTARDAALGKRVRRAVAEAGEA